MKKTSYILLIAAIVCGCIVLWKPLSFAGKEESKPEKVVAITQIVEHPALDRTRQGIIDAFKQAEEKTGVRYKVVFESAQGDTLIASQIAQKFAGMKPDVVIALGTSSAQAVKNNAPNIPLVFSSVTDPIEAKLVEDDNNHNEWVTGCSNWIDLEVQLQRFKQAMPNLKNLGFIYNPSEINSVAILVELRDAAKKYNINIVDIPATASSEVRTAALAIISRVDAIFISNDNTALSAFESAAQVCQEARKAIFVSDVDMIDRGATMAVGPNQYQLGLQTAEMALQVLEGKSPQEFAVQYPNQTEFHINKDVVAAIRMAIPERTWDEADHIFSRNK